MTDLSSIPQTDPRAGYLAQKADIDAAVARVLTGGWYILGKEVEAFEREFAAYIGAAHAVGVGSGTDALELALRELGVGPGDAVLTVSHTAVATVAAIERCGAWPVLVDIDPRYYTMDPKCLEKTLNGMAGRGAGKSGSRDGRAKLPLSRSGGGGARPKVVIPVHLYGQPADMPAILDIARRHNLAVLEDCAQSHGARLNGQMTGTFSDAAAFSFYPTKNLGAFGDGGAVVTSDPALAKRMCALRQYGWEERYISAVPGINSRLDEIHAAMLRVRLTRLETDNQIRRDIAARYTAGLADTSLTLPAVRSGAVHTYHQYVVRCAGAGTPGESGGRQSLIDHLKREKIGTGIHYPVPVHLQPAYLGRLASHPGARDLPHSEQAAQEVLSLPMYPQLTAGEVDRVIAACRSWAKAAS